MKKNPEKTQAKITYGTLSLALFFYMIISGILLAIPFDVNEPYQSVSQMLVINPWASFIRNLHYWSAQLFLILTLLHLYDHYHKKASIGLKKGLAIRLSFGVLVIFLAMLTGFLLKGDSDSEQARQILNYLISGIPVLGKTMAFSFLGKSGNYQLIYVHHIATFSVFIGVIMVEHSKKFWPKNREFIFSFLAILILSYLFSAPLHDSLNPSVKGPWYFVGFQEILHWLSLPSWSILIVFMLILLVYLINTGKARLMFLSKRSVLIFIVFYALLTIIGLFFRGENWRWIFPTQSNYRYSVMGYFKTETVDFQSLLKTDTLKQSTLIQGRSESCLICHSKTHGFQDAHKATAIGCFSCHGGNPFATLKKQAHYGLILIPGNLETANQTCGATQCHPAITQRMPANLMSNLSGMISVDRFVFGEQKTPDSLTDVNHLGNSAADEHLKNLCVKCHLGNPKTDLGPITEESRGGGCLACHLNYNNEALSAFENHQKSTSDTAYLSLHPSLSLQITNDHCFGCHSRSGRISTNYEGWHETILNAEEMPPDSNFRLLKDKRVFTFINEDVHHKLGMECIDCHHSYELMGDGKRYQHEEDQQDVQCIDCHFNGEAHLTKAQDLDTESSLIASLRYGDFKGKSFLTTHKKGHALINAWVKNDTAYMKRKNADTIFQLKAPGKNCAQDIAHQNLNCSSCHSAWAPSCIGCHTSYDANEPGYDMILNKEKKGSWVEFAGKFDAKLPALGIRSLEEGKEIIPVVPGMVLTIDKASFTKNIHDSLIFLRLFAPAAPHTTSAVGRDCKSCHNNPVALGYGEGKLTFEIKKGEGNWKFESFYENNPNDNLPEDAWTGFLQNRTGTVSTRKNVIPFDIKDQERILTVGACLNCHDGESKIMQASLRVPFDEYLKGIDAKCILPKFP